MKVVFALLGLLLVSFAAGQTLEQQCNSGALGEGYFVHDMYCHKFYTCSLDGYWRENTCYAPYVWNQAELGCDVVGNVNCGNLVRSFLLLLYSGDNDSIYFVL